MPCNRAPGTGNTVQGPSHFVNWAGNVIENPQQIYQPTSLDQLVAIVKLAEANNLPVHAVGSGWSFTDVMTISAGLSGGITPGYLVETRDLNGVPQPTNINPPPPPFSPPPIDYGATHQDHPIVDFKRLGTLSETMTGTPYPNDPVFGALTAEALKRNLCHVEAGIKIADLYTTLERIPATKPSITTPDNLWHGYALKTLGGSGGQAIVGAIMTSVHGGDDHDGSGNPIQPLPDMVQGIRLVGAGGVEYFIQRGSGRAIVDPARLAQLDPCLAGSDQIITDDDSFNAAVVSMGRMGIIYSVVLEVRPQYFLTETVHSPCRWKPLSSSVLRPGASGQTIGDFRTNPANRFLSVLILPYASWEQSAIGNNTTASTPFVVPDPTGGPRSLRRLARWTQTNTAIGIAKKMGRTWPPPPKVSIRSLFAQSSAWVYFRGTDIDPGHARNEPGTLWKVRDDGSLLSQIGSNTTASAPFVVPDPSGEWIYFQGTDNALWKIRDDGTQQYHIGENTPAGKQYTASTPFVVPDPKGGAWIYYQGSNNPLLPMGLCKIRDDGSQQSQIGGNTTSSAPFVVPDPKGGAWVYFRGTDNALWKVRDDGTQQYHIGENTPAGKQYTLSTPFVVPDPKGGAWIYYQGSNIPVVVTALCKIRDDGSQQSRIGGNTAASTPFVIPDPKGGAWIYFQGTDNALWRIRDDGSQQSQIGGNTTASAPFAVTDPKGGAWVYFRGTDVGVNNPWGPGTLWKVRDDSDHSCIVTTRSETKNPASPSEPSPNWLFNYVCELSPVGLRAWTLVVIAALEAFTTGTAVLLSLIPFVGPILAGIDVAAAGAIITLLQKLVNNPNTTVGDYLATAENVFTQIGATGLASNLVNQILSGSRSPGQSRTDVSFRIMDTVDYKGPDCYKSLALEVALNSDDTAYINYLNSVFDLIANFQKQNILYGGYISLRYCAGSEALLAMEQWPHTVCIEFGALAHLKNELQVLQAFEDETANHVGADGRFPTVHWGQLNTRTPSQIEAIFPGKINRWRSALARVSANGNPKTFDNDFCKNHGLEIV